MGAQSLFSPRLLLLSKPLQLNNYFKFYPHGSFYLKNTYQYTTSAEKPKKQLQISQHNVNDYMNQSSNPEFASKDGFFSKFKELFRFYKAGIKAVFSNRAEARILERKEKEDIELSRKEHRFILRSKQDFNKLAPFALLVLILPESIPFLVIFAPQFVPSTCISEEQLLKKRTKLQEKRDKITQIALRSTQKSDLLPMDGFSSVDRLLSTVKTYHEGFSYDLVQNKPLRAYCKFMGLSSLAPTFILKSRMQAHFKNIREDDIMILSEGVESLSLEELIEANEERGMRTLDQTEAQLRQTLKDWIAVTNSKSVSAPDLLLVVSRIFINNVRTKV